MLQQQQQRRAEKRAKIWATLFFILLDIVFLVLVTAFAQNFFFLVLGLEVASSLLITAIKSRKPLFIYWSLHGFAWLAGGSFAWTASIPFYYNWNAFWLWLYLPMILSLLLALFQSPLIALLRRVYSRTQPKNASLDELFASSYESGYSGHKRRRISQEMS